MGNQPALAEVSILIVLVISIKCLSCNKMCRTFCTEGRVCVLIQNTYTTPSSTARRQDQYPRNTLVLTIWWT